MAQQLYVVLFVANVLMSEAKILNLVARLEEKARKKQYKLEELRADLEILKQIQQRMTQLRVAIEQMIKIQEVK